MLKTALRYIQICYSQEWEIDQLLQFCRLNFIFLVFAWFFKAKYSTKICPSQKDQLYFKMEGRRSRPSNLLYIYPFQEGHILVEYFALKNQAKSKKWNCAGGAPHPLVYQFYMKKIKIYTKTHKKYANTHKHM